MKNLIVFLTLHCLGTQFLLGQADTLPPFQGKVEKNVHLLNDLTAFGTSFEFMAWDGSTYTESGYYSRIPLTQVMPFKAGAWLKNVGSNDIAAAFLKIETTDQSATLVNSTQTDPCFLGPSDSLWMETSPAQFVLLNQTGQFTSQPTGVINSLTDSDPTNNSPSGINFKVNENQVFARERDVNSSVSPLDFVWGSPQSVLGVDYYFSNEAQVSSISVFIDSATTTPCTWIRVSIFEYTLPHPIALISSEDHLIPDHEKGTWLTLPLIPENAGAEILSSQTHYLAGAMMTSSGCSLRLGADTTLPQNYLQCAFCSTNTGTLESIPILPCIRINLEGAILPPVFQTIADSACVGYLNSYVIHVTDPQGLPVTISGTILPAWITSFQDLGNGYALMSGTPTTTGTAGNLVKLTASNGEMENTRLFTIQVLSGTALCVNDTLQALSGAQVPQVQVFPNPCNGEIWIENAETGSIQIFNLMGIRVAEFLCRGKQEHFDLSHLEPGTYVVHMVVNQTTTSKILSLVRQGKP